MIIASENRSHRSPVMGRDRLSNEDEDMGPNVCVVLCGRSRLILDGLKSIMSERGYEVVFCTAGLDPPCLPSTSRTECLIFIFDLTGANRSTSDIEQVRLSRGGFPSAIIIALADNAELVGRLNQLGIANAVVGPGISAEAMLMIVDLNLQGINVFSLTSAPQPASLPKAHGIHSSAEITQGDLGAPLSNRDRIHNLSERELHIVAGLMAGHSNKTIARNLGIAEGTVKLHVKRILKKIGLTNRTQAAVWGLNNLST